jgi:uncharacterized membrane protein YidH (DUF202 family)
VYDHLLPFGDQINDRSGNAVGRTHVSVAASVGITGDQATTKNLAVGFGLYNGTDGDTKKGPLAEEDPWDDDDSYDMEEEGICGWCFPFCSRYNQYSQQVVAPTSFQKIEPKLFFANERTFLHWLHYSVVLSSIASAILSMSENPGEEWRQWFAMSLLPISLAFVVYSLHIFLWRQDQIKNRIPARWDDPMGPLVLGSLVVLVLVINFFTHLYAIVRVELEEGDI